MSETANKTTGATEIKVVKTDEKKSFGERVREELRFFAGLIAVLLVVFTVVFGHYKIPSESMQPTLEVGDHLYVSKHPYGYSRHSLPFGLHRLPLGDFHWFANVPERGDVAVFRNPKSGIVMIKRVAGLPGEEIEYREGRLFIGGEPVPREFVEDRRYRDHQNKRLTDVEVFEENFPEREGTHTIYEQYRDGPADRTGPWIVPEGHVFMVGDNRDNSIDSRVPGGPGFVPLDHMIGRAEMMVFSFKRCRKEADVFCPGSRWFLPL